MYPALAYKFFKIVETPAAGRGTRISRAIEKFAIENIKPRVVVYMR